MLMQFTCPMCWGTHGCDLPVGHSGNHECWNVLYDEDGNEYYRELCSVPPQYPGQEVFCFSCDRKDNDTEPCETCVRAVV
jgi:hypothetical protein